ncbi:uracil-DNA glycosylase [Paludibacterium paludis]|uniref:Uracil-DNA glycosylase n=1 Tax=Paludibacterium paludis TaxID=1225769 RepID=A0A918U964_9NEIS|nr:uracil-DNA glycosylase [Paludibacterium paludis]GGY12475.1 uracil-DNA glycosylase [Paludibacterium paludis]
MKTLPYLDTSLKRIHPGWLPVFETPAIADRLAAIDAELGRRADAGATVYPPRECVFHALSFFAPADARVVILGQDPYHGEGEAMGLSFSVPDGIRIPPSLRNIYKEIAADTGAGIPASGDLSRWATQGVLLLNSVLTVEADKAGSHGKLGWQTVTEALIDTVNRDNPGCVFLLWGNWARAHAEKIDTSRHLVLEAAHPSPLSASRGFFGCRHFSESNAWLAARGKTPVIWSDAGREPTLF